MEITVYKTGRCKTISVREIKKATIFFAELVLGKRLAKNIAVDIFLEDLLFSEAFCHAIPFGRAIRDFEISINKNLSRKSILRALAHEMVHVRQFAHGKLKFIDIDVSKWGKRVYRHSYSNYFKLPWEVEAHKLETELFKAYLKQCKTSK